MSIDILTISHLSKKFAHEEQKIFDHASFTFRADQSYALMGPSGIGKTTLLAIIAGIAQQDQGTIHINNGPLIKGQIGLICQQPSLIAELSVVENVLLHAIIQEKLNKEIIQRAQNLLQAVGLGHKIDSLVHTLSGGQQQKVAILRSMLYPPHFLLADEPTGNLDRQSADQIMQMLLHYQKKYIMGLIVSTHDVHIAQQCDVIVSVVNQQLIITS